MDIIRRGSFRKAVAPIHSQVESSQTLPKKNFFEGQDYQLFIQCLNGGYDVAEGIMADMKAFRVLLKKTIKNHKSYSKKCQARINGQSPVSSYHTTKDAQILTVGSSETVAQSLENLRRLIKNEINSYEATVKRMYVRKFPRMTRVHYQSKRLEKLFMDEYSTLSKMRKEVKSGQEQSSNAPLGSGEGNVTEAPKNITEAELIYRTNLTNIYRDARTYEEDRLNDIRKVLISFVTVIHSVPQIGGLNQSYQDLITKIGEKQNTKSDLDFWAKTYGIPLVANQVSTASNPSNSITTAGNGPLSV